MTESDRKEMVKYYCLEIETHMQEGDFQRNLFESLNDQWKSGRNLSDKQYDSLERIYERVTK